MSPLLFTSLNGEELCHVMMSSLNFEINVYGVWFLMTVLSFPWICEYNDEFLFSCSGLPEECKVQTPAFTDAVRLYRQAHGHYGTWDMMCGTPPQVKQKTHMYLYSSCKVPFVLEQEFPTRGVGGGVLKHFRGCKIQIIFFGDIWMY